MKGYKFLLDGYKSKCGEFTYEIGKTYVHDGKIELCESGFHFSKTIRGALCHVNGDICVEIEAGGRIVSGNNKYVCSEITILHELDIQGVLEMLSKDNDWQIRAFVTKNPKTPISLLKKLKGDVDWYVKGRARDSLKDRRLNERRIGLCSKVLCAWSDVP